MNELKVLDAREVLGKEFKIYGDIENPLFLAKDVAEWIDYAKTGKGLYDVSKMLNTIDDTEKLVRTIFVSGQNREMWFLTEDGLYEVLMLSRKPIAKAFKREVKDILKSIRKTGMYATDQLLDDPDLAIKAFTALKEERERRKALEQKIIEDTPKIAFANNIEGAKRGILVREFSKILGNEGIDLGERKLYHWLREHGLVFLYSTEPTQDAIKKGLLCVEERVLETDKGSFITHTTRVTGKGQIQLLQMIKRELEGDDK